jgi:hypothetical protein
MRDDLERSLEPGETMTSFLKLAVQRELARRREQSEFVRRGLASIARSEAAGDWVHADAVIANLEAKVTAARERRAKHAS